MPTVLHVLIAIAGGYSVGSEFASRSLQRMAGGRGRQCPLTALVGKLAPYFGVFLLMMAVGVGRHPRGVRHSVPRRSALDGGAACLLLIAYLSLGRPVSAAGQKPCARPGPHRHHLLARLRLRRGRLSRHRDGGFAPDMGRAAAAALVYPDSVRPSGARVFLSPIPPRLSRARRAWRRAFRAGLVAAAGRRKGAAVSARSRRRQPKSRARISVSRAFAAEYRRVLGDRGRLRPDRAGADHLRRALSATLCRAACFAMFPSPSSMRTKPISAEPSCRRSNADEAIKVAARPATLAEARMALTRREVFAIVGIPGGRRARCAEGRRRAVAGLCRFRLFPAVQPHAAGHSARRPAR